MGNEAAHYTPSDPLPLEQIKKFYNSKIIVFNESNSSYEFPLEYEPTNFKSTEFENFKKNLIDKNPNLTNISIEEFYEKQLTVKKNTSSLSFIDFEVICYLFNELWNNIEGKDLIKDIINMIKTNTVFGKSLFVKIEYDTQNTMAFLHSIFYDDGKTKYTMGFNNKHLRTITTHACLGLLAELKPEDSKDIIKAYEIIQIPGSPVFTLAHELMHLYHSLIDLKRSRTLEDKNYSTAYSIKYVDRNGYTDLFGILAGNASVEELITIIGSEKITNYTKYSEFRMYFYFNKPPRISYGGESNYYISNNIVEAICEGNKINIADIERKYQNGGIIFSANIALYNKYNQYHYEKRLQ